MEEISPTEKKSHGKEFTFWGKVSDADEITT